MGAKWESVTFHHREEMTMKSTIWILLALLCLPGVVRAQKIETNALITKKTQKAIDESLGVLAKQQNADGSFGTGQYNGNVAVTALAGLAFLSKGADENYDKVVAKAVKSVLSEEDPKRPGYLQNPKAISHGPMYGHGFAVLFLVDAHDSIKDEKLRANVRATLERSVKLIIDSQNKEGGWRYQPVKGDADISVTACQVAALRAARDLGIGIPRQTLDLAAQYVKGCQVKESGGFRYQTFGGSPGFARSAAGVVSLDRLGFRDEKAIKKGVDFVRRVRVKEPNAEMAMHFSYGHYYAAKAMWYSGDKDWQEWYPVIRDELVGTQTKEHQWKQGLMCTHYSTSVALIILQMPNQKLPSLKR